MYKRLFSLVLLGFFLAACSSSASQSPLNTGRVDIDEIQLKFREVILSQYEEPERKILVIAPPSSSVNSSKEQQGPSEELKIWRADISMAWNQIPDDKFFMVCGIIYEGLLDPESTFANSFSEVRKQFAQDGVRLYSLTDVRLESDNRESINFPTAESSSSLFVCSAQMSLKIANGQVLSPQKSTVAWNYYIDAGEIRSTVSFILKSNS